MAIPVRFQYSAGVSRPEQQVAEFVGHDDAEHSSDVGCAGFGLEKALYVGIEDGGVVIGHGNAQSGFGSGKLVV